MGPPSGWFQRQPDNACPTTARFGFFLRRQLEGNARETATGRPLEMWSQIGLLQSPRCYRPLHGHTTPSFVTQVDDLDRGSNEAGSPIGIGK